MIKKSKGVQVFSITCILTLLGLLMFVLPSCVGDCMNYEDVSLDGETVTDTIIFVIDRNARDRGIAGCLNDLGIAGCYDGGCCGDGGTYVDIGIFSCAYMSRWSCTGCLSFGCDLAGCTVVGCFSCIPVGPGGCMLCPALDE